MSTRPSLNFGPLPANAYPYDIEAGAGLGYRVVETTQRYAFGARGITWDGGVFRYSKSGSICYTGRGNYFEPTILSNANGIDYAVLAAAASAGDTSVKLTAATVARTENELSGGHLVLKPTETYTDAHLMQRVIIGNSAAAIGGVCTIYFEEPLETALTTSNYGFAMASPFSDMRNGTTAGFHSFGGPAASYVAASGSYFWTKVRGMAWLAAQAGPGVTAYYRKAYWRHDGSIDIGSNIATYVTDQEAGIIMDNNTSANGSTLIFLTGPA